MSVALAGTYRAKLRESIEFAEKNRADVAVVARSVRIRVERRLTRLAAAQRRDGPETREVDLAVDSDLEKDKWVKLAVANEQWGGRLAMMYALADIAAAQHSQTELLREIRDLLSLTLNDPARSRS